MKWTTVKAHWVGCIIRRSFMSLPTLKELGLSDGRKHIPDEVKIKIKKELESGTTNMTYLSKKYGVSVCTVRMIRNPEHEKALMKKSRDNNGGFRKYYNRERQTKRLRNLCSRKEDKIRKIVEEYNKLKGEDK